MAYGEFDELSTVEATIDLYDKITAPKRLLIFEQEFHALGGVGAELIGSAASWLELALAGEIPAGDAQQAYVQRSGDIRDTSAEPAWWTRYARPAPVRLVHHAAPGQGRDGHGGRLGHRPGQRARVRS